MSTKNSELTDILKEIGNSGASYAAAANAVLKSVSAAADVGIALGDSTRQVLGTMGIPDATIRTQAELVALAEALSIVLLGLTEAEDHDNTELEYEHNIEKYRETYGNMTDEQLSDMVDPAMFSTMSELERMAASVVLVDIAVDRGIKVAPIWKQIGRNLGIQ